MFKKLFSIFITLLLILTIVSCSSKDPSNTDDNIEPTNSSIDDNNTDEPDEATSSPSDKKPQGNPDSKFNEDWPTEMLPDGFPNLGKVTKVFDSRAFVKKISINWSVVTEDEVHKFYLEISGEALKDKK